MTTIYDLTYIGDDGPYAYPTLKDAKAMAREIADTQRLDVGVQRIVLADLPARELAVALLTGTGYVATSEVVWTAHAPPEGRGYE
jgi:hypothetical protein